MADKYDFLIETVRSAPMTIPAIVAAVGSFGAWIVSVRGNRLTKVAISETRYGNDKLDDVHGAVANAAGAAVDASQTAADTALSAKQATTESTEMMLQAMRATLVAMDEHRRQIADLQKQVGDLIAQFSPSEPKP